MSYITLDQNFNLQKTKRFPNLVEANRLETNRSIKANPGSLGKCVLESIFKAAEETARKNLFDNLILPSAKMLPVNNDEGIQQMNCHSLHDELFSK